MIAFPGHIFLIVKEIIETVTACCVNGLRFLPTTVLRLWHGSVQRDQTTCFQRDVLEMTPQVKWFVLVDAGCVQDTGPHWPSDTCYVSRTLLDCGGLTLTEHTHADIAQGHLFCVVSKQYCGFWEGGCGFCCIPQWSNSSRPHKKVQWCLVYYTWTKTDPRLIWIVNIKYLNFSCSPQIQSVFFF